MMFLERAALAALLMSSVGLARVCRDGWGNTGVCVQLRSCSSFQALLRPKDPVTGKVVQPSRENIQKLRASICPTKAKGFFVCCSPPTPPPPPSTTTTTTTTTTTPKPVDISQFDPNTPEGNPKRLLLPPAPYCGQNAIKERIVGGQEANVGDFPWLALIGYEEEDLYGFSYDYDSYDEDGEPMEDAEEGPKQPSYTFSCGATLINERYVLTAAHCIPSPGSGRKIVKVRLGEHNLENVTDCQVSNMTGDTYCNDPPVDIDTDQIISHAGFNKPFRNKNDIALIRLAQPVNYTTWVRPICLPFEEWRTDNPPGTEPYVAGFGLTAAYGDKSPTLQVLRVPLTNMTVCARKFRELRAKVGEGQVCAGGEKGKDSCEGDSGGPLMQHARFGPPFYLRGVVSFGTTRCGGGRIPGVYTDVAKYMDWILEKISF